MTGNILVVAAHPDDEALGCGGTIAAQTAAGRNVHVIFLTDGVGSRTEQSSAAKAWRRQAAAQAAAELLGILSVTHLSFPDNRLDTVALLDVVQAIEPVIDRLRPEIIYTHCAYDLNVDHRVCHQAVLTACRPQPEHAVRSIFGFEVPSSTEWAFSSMHFDPRYFFDITDHLQTKLDALAKYQGEMRSFPHSRSIESIEALARWRGSTVGLRAAEAFSVIRQIEKVD